MSTPSANEGWGPEMEGRSRRHGPLRRILLTILILLLAAAVALPVLATQRLNRAPVEGLASGGQPMHVLVTGSDSREGLSREEQIELSTGIDDFGQERTDTIFLLTVRSGEAAMLAFPRDLWVTRCDGSTGRINVAQAIDGPGCLVDTVRQLSGIQAHHYVRVTFAGFRDVVDAIGGVELCLEAPIADRDAGIDLPAGCQRLDGADALGYVRVRKIDDDLQRIQRQQTFVQALAREITRPAVLFNPVRLWQLSGEMGEAVQVDDSLGPLGLLRLVGGARALAAGEVATSTVPGSPRITSGGAWVLDPQQPEADALFASFRDGSVLEEAAAGDDEDPEARPRRSEISVIVANGAGIDGLAGRVAADLEARGYEVVGVTNAEPTERTRIHYPSGQQAAARLAAEDVPGSAIVEESAAVETVTIILGPEAST